MENSNKVLIKWWWKPTPLPHRQKSEAVGINCAGHSQTNNLNGMINE